MPRNFLILCGGARLTTNSRACRTAKPIVLNAPLRRGNVLLRIADITRRPAAELPDVLIDLVEIATYVYCADQAVRRGGKAEFEYGEKWRRRFRLEVPVRRLDVWLDPVVQAELVRTLSFLSDDDYEFGFTRHPDPPRFSEYLPYDAPDADTNAAVDSVMLFSGGLDSLAGAVEEVFGADRRVALVSHRPVSKIDNRQRELADRLATRVQDPTRKPIHISVWANKEKELGREYTQRTRSFLFGALGFAVASLFGVDTLNFYENGVVSLNLPICAQVLGGRASRTTHPQALWRMQSLFSHVVGRAFRINNPFLWKTKTDVVVGVRQAGHGDLVQHTVSCAHTWETTAHQPHCGKCSQCIDRKLAAIAAGLTNVEDPDDGYRVPVLTGTFADVEHRTLVERVVGNATRVAEFQDPTRLYAEYGEASRVLRYLDLPADEGALRVFSLHRRHALQVMDALRLSARGTASTAGFVATANCMIALANGSASSIPDAAPPPATPSMPATGFVPTEDDVAILRALARSVTTIFITDLAVKADVSRRTAGDRVRLMLRYRLMDFPRGGRQGVVITELGRALLKRVDASNQQTSST